MDTCIADLEDARPNEATHMGGVTKYTALMLKAKAAMDLAGNDNGSPYWDVVLDCTNQIIASGKFSLFEDYYQLWKNPGKLSDESILEFQYSDFGAETWRYRNLRFKPQWSLGQFLSLSGAREYGMGGNKRLGLDGANSKSSRFPDIA